MRDWYDSDEECDKSFDEEEEIPEEEEYSMLPKKSDKTVKVDKNESFDEKVAVSIVNIHRNVRRNVEYRKWVRKNSRHLAKLYKLSELKCSQQEFNRYTYENTVH